MNTGYQHVEPQLGNYIHGDGRLGTVPLQPDGQWDAFLPPTEDQSSNGFEPRCCVSEGVAHAGVEILARQEYGNTMQRSVRFLATNSGTGAKQGNDPQSVCESLRLEGIVYESDYPFSAPDYNTFYQTLTRALKALAIGEFAEFAYGHSWVNPVNPESLMEALTFSPLSAAGYAWEIDPQTGYYISPKGSIPGHYFVICGYDRNNYWKVRDSYPPFDKKLAWDFQFTGVKRHTLHRQLATTPRAQTAWNKFLALLQQIYNSLLYGSFGGVPRSPQWSEVRNAFIKANPTCAVCGCKGTLLKPLNAHHLQSFATRPDLELSPENLCTVCRVHHLWFCHLGAWASLNEDAQIDTKVWGKKIARRPKWNGKGWVYLPLETTATPN